MNSYRRNGLFLTISPLKFRRVFPSISFIGTAIAGIAFIFGLAAMKALIPIKSSHPATVPEGYVVTPFGYFHPTCVKQLSIGDAILKDEGVIRHVNGTSDSLPTCEYPHYSAKGEVIAATTVRTQGKLPTISDSWVEAASLLDNLSELVASWPVPPAPTSNDGQTLFFFPGMIDTNSNLNSIMQPVLGWNRDFPNAWSIASWNCCIAGITMESSPQAVNPGDVITGTIQSTCSAGTLSCSSWNITTQDVTSGATPTSLSQSSSDGLTFNEAYAGVVEVYNVAQCSDYPPNGSIEFSNIQVYDYNFNYISTPPWSFDNYYSGSEPLTPQCNYGGITPPQEITLTYGVATPFMSDKHTCDIFGGTVRCTDAVTITDSTLGASIYYTIDGTTPTASSTLYSGVFSYTAGEIVQSIAVINSTQSAVATILHSGNS